MPSDLLVRYGAIPEIGRFECEMAPTPERGTAVVVQTLRGLELGTVLEAVRPASDVGNGAAHPDSVAEPKAQRLLHVASREEISSAAALRNEAQSSFDQWSQRMADWKLQLDLLDLEWTLDRQKLVLYVLGGRGPETTRLALLAAAAGLAVVEVQPVGGDGPVPEKASRGGCGGGGCSH